MGFARRLPKVRGSFRFNGTLEKESYLKVQFHSGSKMNRVIRSISIAFLVIMLLSLIVSRVHAKTFHGQVIDADTKEPIEGAAVVAYWYKARVTTIGDENLTLKDIKETLTDKNGQWTITGPKGRIHDPFPYFSTITGIYYTKEPQFIIFKPGYCSWPKGFSIEACKGKMKSKGPGQIMEGKILELPKLADRQDRLKVCPNTISSSSDDPREEIKIQKKQLDFLRLINEERRNLGLSEYKLYQRLRNEK